MAAEKQPYKVWSADRSKKKAVVASSLKELIKKGKEKLDVSGGKPLTLVLEEDGTEVDDEEYFRCLQPNFVFLLLREGESWHPSGYYTEDATDGSLSLNVDPQTSRSLVELATVLREDISRIITFSNNEMQIIVECNTAELKSLLGKRGEDAAHIQESCQRHLDDREKTIEAMQLLKMLGKSSGQETQDSANSASSPKRKKIE